MATATSRMLAYDCGYRVPFGHSNLIRLDNELKLSLSTGSETVEEYFCDARGGKIAYLDYITKNILATYMNSIAMRLIQLVQKPVFMPCHSV